MHVCWIKESDVILHVLNLNKSIQIYSKYTVILSLLMYILHTKENCILVVLLFVYWCFVGLLFGGLQCCVIPIVRACSPTSHRLQLQIVYEVHKSVLNVCSLFLKSISTLSNCLPLEAVVSKCLIRKLTPPHHSCLLEQPLLIHLPFRGIWMATRPPAAS